MFHRLTINGIYLSFSFGIPTVQSPLPLWIIFWRMNKHSHAFGLKICSSSLSADMTRHYLFREAHSFSRAYRLRPRTNIPAHIFKSNGSCCILQIHFAACELENITQIFPRARAFGINPE